MPYALSDGLEIFYEINGNGRTPAIVFVHGGAGGNHTDWQGQVDYFANRYRTITLDLRGNGKSSKHEDSEYSIERYAQDLASVIDDSRVSDVILVGHSLGGNVVLEYWKNNNEKVKGIVLVEPGQGIITEEYYNQKMAMSDDELEASTAATLQNNFSPRATAEFRKKMLSRVNDVPRQIRLASHRNLVKYWRSGESLRIALIVDNPVLMVQQTDSSRGRAGEIPDRDKSFALLASAFRTLTFHKIRGTSGHWFYVDTPYLLNKKMEPYLSEITDT